MVTRSALTWHAQQSVMCCQHTPCVLSLLIKCFSLLLQASQLVCATDMGCELTSAAPLCPAHGALQVKLGLEEVATDLFKVKPYVYSSPSNSAVIVFSGMCHINCVVACIGGPAPSNAQARPPAVCKTGTRHVGAQTAAVLGSNAPLAVWRVVVEL